MKTLLKRCRFQLAEVKQAMTAVLKGGHRKRPEVVQALAEVCVIRRECFRGGVQYNSTQ
jgi:ABC-type lipopolysaccharide export system ATPase subunit